MLYKRLEVDFSFTDNRGTLTQLVHKGYEQVNVLESKAGVVRGGHFHKETREAFFVVSGSVMVELKKDNVVEKHKFEKGDLFEFEPYVIHSMKFDEDCILIAMYDKCVERENGVKDIFPAD